MSSIAGDMNVMGFLRSDGLVGLRNLVLVVSLSDLTNDVANSLVWSHPSARCLLAPTGGLSFGQELAFTTRLFGQLCHNPNVGTVVILGTDRKAAECFAENACRDGCEHEIFITQEWPDTNALFRKASSVVAGMAARLASSIRKSFDLSCLRVGLRSSNTSRQSSLTVHPAASLMVSSLVDAGSTVAFSEIADLAGDPEAASATIAPKHLKASVRGVIQEARTILTGLGSDAPDPTPVNRHGGIETLASKTAAAMRRVQGTKIASLQKYGDTLPRGGLHLIDGPGSAWMSLLGFAASGCTIVLQTVGANSFTASFPLLTSVILAGDELADSSDVDLMTRGQEFDVFSSLRKLSAVASGTLAAAEEMRSKVAMLPNWQPPI